MTLQAFGQVGKLRMKTSPVRKDFWQHPLLHLYIMKEMSLCKLVHTILSLVCVLLLTVLSYIFIYFTFFALLLINFDILSGVDTKWQTATLESLWTAAVEWPSWTPEHDFLSVAWIPTNRVQKLLIAGSRSRLLTWGSLNIINRLIEAWLDVHYKLVCLLSPSSFKVESDGHRAKNTSLDRLRIYSCPVQ